MKIGKPTYIIFTLFVLSFCAIAFLDYEWDSIIIQVICSLSLPISIILFLWDVVRFKKSMKLLMLSLYLIVASKIAFSTSNLISYFMHYIGEVSFWGTRSIFTNIWIVFIIILIVLITRMMVNDQKSSFRDLIESRVFKIISSLILITILMEMPIFDIHPDLGGGLHGHSFWFWSHLH